MVTGADGWSPTDPAVERRSRSAGIDVTGVHQDRALAFGDKETVNAIDAATPGCPSTGCEGDDRVRRRSAPDGAIVDEGWATEHGLGVGDAFELTSANGDEARPDGARHRALAGASTRWASGP